MIHYSPSQVKTARDCPRKWAFRYIAGLPGKPYHLADLGTYIHKVLEKYLKTGWLEHGSGVALELETPRGKKRWTHDQIVDIVLPGMIYLPEPGPSNVVEQGFSIPLKLPGPPAEMVGKIDLRYLGNNGRDTIVHDHKSTTNLAYAHTNESLKDDPQAIVYSKAAFDDTCLGFMTVRFGYLRTSKEPKAQLAECIFNSTTLEYGWQNIMETVRELHGYHTSGKQPNEIPHNPMVCDKFGGCPYSSVCDRSVAERIGGLFAMVSLKDRMKAATPTNPAPAPESTQVQSAEPAVGLNPPEGNSVMARLQAMRASAPVEPQALPPNPEPELVEHELELEPEPAPEPESIPRNKTLTPPEPAPLPERRISLYINCAPNVEYTEFAQLVKPVLDDLKTEYGHHYKLIPDLYGGNGGLFSEALGQHLDETEFAGPVVVNLADPVVRDALNALETRAWIIVRGF